LEPNGLALRAAAGGFLAGDEEIGRRPACRTRNTVDSERDGAGSPIGGDEAPAAIAKACRRTLQFGATALPPRNVFFRTRPRSS
jgi:hypothetical protein